MRHSVTAVALFGAAMLATSALTADEPKKDEKKDAKAARKEFSALMKGTHRGEKSPHTRIVMELKKEAPDWDQLAKDAKAFEDVGKAFKNVDLGYASPEKYIKGTAALTKAVGAKDKKAANEAFIGLTNSCGACHNYGGPALALSFDADRLLK